MKRFIVVLSLIASPALAQIGPVPAGGAGSIGSGTSLTSCTSSILYADASSLLKCDPAAVVSGSVSTAGRSILTIKDTISGASATSNFLNITGTFPATLSAETSAGLVSVTGDNDAQTQNGFKAVLASAGANSRQRGLSALVSGTHVNIESQAIYGENTSVGASGWSIGVAGNTVVNTAAKSLSGMTAVASASNANGTNTVGGWFVGGGNGGTTTNIFGVIGTAYSTGTNGMGGFFFLNSTSGLDPFGNFPNNYATVTGKAALVADNTSVAANIFEARDNGTAVLTVADGGATTFTVQSVHNGGALIAQNQRLSVGGLGYLYGLTSLTPDAPAWNTSTTNESLHFFQLADNGYDFNNGRCGTSACTNPALIVHSSDQSTTEYAQISTDTSGAAGFQSNFAELRVGGTKTAITESSAQAIIRVGIPTSTNVYGMTVFYTVYDINAANYVTRTGSVKVQGGNSGGTATCTINTTQDAEGEDGSQIATSNAATLTYTWTNVAATTNCDLSLNAASSEGTNTYAVTWTAVLTGNSSAITITGQ